MSRVTELRRWRLVSDAYNLRVDLEPAIQIDGAVVTPLAIVRNVGAPKGMLIFHTQDAYSEADEILRSAAAEGFGYSCISLGDDKSFSVDQFGEVLRDWGYTGPSDERPRWAE